MTGNAASENLDKNICLYMFFREGSSRDLAEKVNILASSDALREEMGTAGYAVVSDM